MPCVEDCVIHEKSVVVIDPYAERVVLAVHGRVKPREASWVLKLC